MTTEDAASPPERPDYTVIVPVYNEAENFPRLIEQVERELPGRFRLLVCYDFDGDTTVPVARELSKTRPWIELIRNDLGRGPAFAIQAGFQAAGDGPTLVVMADLSDDLAVVEKMLLDYKNGAKVVCASRYMKGGQQLGGPWFKGFLSRMAGHSLYYLRGFPTHDATNNFRLYDAALIRELKIESRAGFELAIELTAKAWWAGAKVTEVPSTWRDRTAGESRFRLFKWLPAYLRWYFFVLFGRRFF